MAWAEALQPYQQTDLLSFQKITEHHSSKYYAFPSLSLSFLFQPVLSFF